MSAKTPEHPTTVPVERKRGRPIGATAAITLDAVLPQVRCRSGDLQRWQAQAEDEGVPFAEWCRQRLNAGVR